MYGSGSRELSFYSRDPRFYYHDTKNHRTLSNTALLLTKQLLLENKLNHTHTTFLNARTASFQKQLMADTGPIQERKDKF